MNKIVSFAVFMMLVCGCASVDVSTPSDTVYDDAIENARKVYREWKSSRATQEVEVESEIPMLNDFTSSRCEVRPEKGEVYTHDEGDIRVIQVVKEKIKEEDRADGLPEEIEYVLAAGYSLTIGVYNDREYVTGEMLVKGDYRYLGTYTYPVSRIIDGVEKKSTNTIRMFAEVGCAFDKFYMKDAPQHDAASDKQEKVKKAKLSDNEESRCLSCVQRVFYSRWERPRWDVSLRDIYLGVLIGEGGKVLGYDIVQSSGDEQADLSVLKAASEVSNICGLSQLFIEKFNSVVVRFSIAP